MGKFVDLEVVNTESTFVDMKEKLASARLTSRSVAYYPQNSTKNR